MKNLFPEDKRLMEIFTHQRLYLQYANALGVQAMIGDEAISYESFHIILPPPAMKRHEIAQIFPRSPEWLDSIPQENVTTVNTVDDVNDLLTDLEPGSKMFRSHSFFFHDFRSIMDVIGSRPPLLRSLFKTFQASTRHHANRFMMTNVLSVIPAVDKLYCDRIFSLKSPKPSLIELSILDGTRPYILSLASDSLRFEIASRKASKRDLVSLVKQILNDLSERSTDGYVDPGKIMQGLLDEGFSREDAEIAFELCHDAGEYVKDGAGRFKLVH